MKDNPRGFESGVKRLLGRIGSLEEKLKSEEKIVLIPSPFVVPSESGIDTRLFLPGNYLKNMSKRDLKNIKELIREWKKAAVIGRKKYKEVMRMYATDMDFAFDFLMLAYKPVIFPKSGGVVGITYRAGLNFYKETQETLEIRGGFRNYYRREIEKGKEKFRRKRERSRRPISDEEVDKAREELYGEEIRELRIKLGKGYDQETAERLYDIYGRHHKEEFFEVINKGRKKKE